MGQWSQFRGVLSSWRSRSVVFFFFLFASAIHNGKVLAKSRKIDVNGANNHHDPFPDTNDHLGYRQVACKQVSPSILWDRFEVQICDWDDSQFGRTIRDGIGSCGLQTEWKFEDSTFKFVDGSSAQKYASLRMPTVAGRKCITNKIEEALGLSQGSVTCNNNWNEVSMF